LKKDKETVVGENDGVIQIDIEKLRTTQFPQLLLLEVLSPLNFNSSVVDEVFHSLEAESGKQFFSKTHRLVKDRDQLFISELKESEEKIYYIEKDDVELFEPFDILVQTADSVNFDIIKRSNVACIGYDMIQFPLLIRKWKQGDYFQPLGMTGIKKVSDFLIDRKVPLHEKENVWLLCSGKKIVWIMGLRLDERFKVTSDTKKVLVLKIE